jgi:hypothetical protein
MTIHMCMGSHDATGMISPCCHNAMLSNESIHSSNAPVWYQNPKSAVANNLIIRHQTVHKILSLSVTLAHMPSFVHANGSDKLSKIRNTKIGLSVTHSKDRKDDKESKKVR